VSSEALRNAVRDRAGRRCEYCHLPDVLPHTLRFHMEHILPRQHGGLTEMSNLAWCCQRCNARKGPNLTGLDPDTSLVVSLFHPREDNWEKHFSMDALTIVGLTAKGRTTAWLLEMNSEERICWRAALQRYGLF
jgi:hypothetical protein